MEDGGERREEEGIKFLSRYGGWFIDPFGSFPSCGKKSGAVGGGPVPNRDRTSSICPPFSSHLLIDTKLLW